GGAANHNQPPQQKMLPAVAISDLSEDLYHGLHLVALIDADCDHCQESVPAFNQIFEKKGSLRSFAALSSSPPNRLQWLVQEFGAKFPIGKISEADFMKLLTVRGSTPRIFLLRDGAILKMWEVEVPSDAEIKSAIK